jgi:hypothetical protein
MNVPLIAAGCLALLGTGVHGAGGELLVVRNLSSADLPGTRFGGPKATMAMIRASWHITTVAFLTVAIALLLAGSVLDGDVKRAVAVLAASAATGFAAVVVAVGIASNRSTGALWRHPGPVVLSLTAALAWIGAL